MKVNYGFQNYPESISRDVDIPDWSLPQMLAESVRKHPDAEAMSFYGQKTTYKQLADAVSLFASRLQQAGIQKGDRVAIMLPNSPHFVISYYGILTAGAVVTQVNPMLVERELAHILQDSGAKAIVALDAVYPRVKAVESESDVSTVVVVSLQPSGVSFAPDVTFEEFLEQGKTVPVTPVSVDPAEDLAILQYTGGTTGRSKGAMLTHRNLLANVIQSYEFFKDEFRPGQDRCLTVIPLFHVFGMTSCMNLTLYTGSSLVLLPRFDIKEVLETIQREKPTTFPGVPTMYVALTNYPGVESYGVNSIRTCNSGSAPMPVELLREFERKTGAKILEGYGLSEASPTTHCNPPFTERKPGSVGVGFPSTEYKIVDTETGEHEMPVGELGELVVRGPQVMKGYWNMPEETAKTLRDGWLYTGDIAKMDEDGYLYIMDRKKDLIIASGYNVYPREIEEVIYEHPAVKEAAVVGVADPYRGETVKAFIVLKDGASCTEEEMSAYCKANMAPYKVPKLIEFRTELPKTNVGKVLRRTLRETEAEAAAGSQGEGKA
ncbi:long-chain-fatty-acid--CoA ligase [Alicyclobacillus ferrooxydans]|uniref:AMP-dependent synthetase n=1 Tax=Alicyclobacillus ferrooxydans TaxID=471514 RepID=A0A0P9D4P8_9BACL|nr:long-chain fatty acid--CoA ligase [Alicyclobacillus ferrooxydans]KPV44418.1 AMP-dependent synthetase [Alicyclobacillus ferrooxydans]